MPLYTPSVTSVGLALPAEFNISGSPVTSAGTLTGSWANQSAGRFLGGPSSGAASTPAFRQIVPPDLAAQSTGALVYDNNTAYGTIASVATGKVLKSAGVSTVPAWGTITGNVLPLFGSNTGPTGTTVHYIPPGYGNTSGSTEIRIPIVQACTIDLFYFQYVLGAAGGTATITLRLNSVDQALSVTIPTSGAAGQVSDTSNSITAAVGDVLSLKVVGSGAGVTRCYANGVASFRFSLPS